MDKRDILVVFDIDETLIQFINKNAYHFWKETTEEQKAEIDENLEYIDRGDQKKQVIIFRPGLRDFLRMVMANPRIKIAIWTYSEREYAYDIADAICSYFEVPEDIFIFKYGAEDIEDDDIPKSLKQIWDNEEFCRQFNKFNTFLVDDRYGNLCHHINKSNSILVQAFAPFGENKKRERLTQSLLETSIQDDIFFNLIKITTHLLADIDGCSDEEIDDAFHTEEVFAPRCMVRKGLGDYLKYYEDGIQMCTIGHVENAASSIKGGRYKKTRKHRNTKTKLRKRMRKSGKTRRFKRNKAKRIIHK